MMALIEALVADHPEALSPLGAGLMTAAHLGIAHDSRSFARKFGLAHALVLRECTLLAHDHDLLMVESRGDKSQRLFYQLSDTGRATVERACDDTDHNAHLSAAGTAKEYAS
ncbi:hypothetical protein [Tritonibacter mobilis]|uniref:hypothetical protein n=1 Tax=Tritonibacter mobilis TaxID=379347 RepID=UPI00197FD872|nr:hypothetical protein [Tritonibacter mobilis]